MVIKNDVSAVNSARMLQMTNKAQSKTMEKLSSGYKINKSADDASGLAISEKLMKQINSLNKAIDNASDGMAMTDTADGAMNEVGDMLQRLNDLAIQGSNGTLSESDRADVQAEADQILSDINRVGGSTKFNELYLMNGEASDIQAGADNSGSNRVTVKLEEMNADTLGLGSVDFSTAESSRASLGSISDAVKMLADQRSGLGAGYNRMSSTTRNLANVSENTTAAQSSVKDTDMASELIKQRRNKVQAQANMALMRRNQEERNAQAGTINSLV
ncbi:MAG: flagellin [Lachnospiraceae bacterium]|nr:flagellin [Lachnospiraceae bacterium]